MIKGKYKKGALTDLFIFMIIAFVMSICVVALFYATTTAENELRNNIDILQGVVGDGNNATQILDDTFGRVPDALQSLKWITGMLIIGMILSIIVTAFLIRTRPVFLVPYILIWITAIILAVPLSNSYEQIYEHPTLSASFSGFFAQTYIMLNLHIWIAIIGGIAGMVMFVNMVRQSQFGGYE